MLTIDDMIDRFDGSLGYATNSEEICQYIADLLKELKDRRKLPEIVKCKDCENWDTTWQNDSAPNYHYCPMMDGTYRGDFYCGKAERRTDEQQL